jgi:hypothetical protein
MLPLYLLVPFLGELAALIQGVPLSKVISEGGRRHNPDDLHLLGATYPVPCTLGDVNHATGDKLLLLISYDADPSTALDI